MYTTSLLLTLLPLLATTSPISTLESRNPTAPNAGFLLYMGKCAAGEPTVSAPVSSKSKFCFNLDAKANAGTFVWPQGDDSYQAVIYTAPDCPEAKQEKQFGTKAVLYTAKVDVGNGTSVECMGSLWADPGEGSVWMSPSAEKAPGGWPPAVL